MRLFLLLFTLSLPALAEQSRHQVTFGNNLGVGWSASSSASETGLGIDDFEAQINNFSLNYAYRWGDRWQFGAAWAQLSDEQDIALDGGDLETEVRQTHMFIFATYNFHDQLQKAFFLTALFGRQHFEHASNDKRPTVLTGIDVEYDLTTYGLAFGKRFSVGNWDDNHISYSPSITYWVGEAGGDLDNDGLDRLNTLRIDVVRFDFLF